MTEIEKSNARRLKQQLPDMDEDPAAAQWREKAFNFYDKRSVQAVMSTAHAQDHPLVQAPASVSPAFPPPWVWDVWQLHHACSGVDVLLCMLLGPELIDDTAHRGCFQGNLP